MTEIKGTSINCFADDFRNMFEQIFDFNVRSIAGYTTEVKVNRCQTEPESTQKEVTDE